MPIKPYFDQVEPRDDAEIWRFMNLHKFQDLMANEELYFCRADLFSQDEEEGIPPEEYMRLVMGLERYVLKDETDLNHHIGTFSQSRESYFVSCWHLYRKETPEMWKDFGQDGVAVCSRYDLLKSTLNGMLDSTHAGLVQYGDKHLKKTMRVNTLQLITTKRERFAGECELRAFLDCPDFLAGQNLHFDKDNFPHRRPLPENEQFRHHWSHRYKRRRIDLKSLITGIVVCPGASKELIEEIELFVKLKQHAYKVRRSELT